MLLAEQLREESTKKSFCVREGKDKQQRSSMWLKLNVYHVQGQWVTYFRQCSFIRLKIYNPPTPTSSLFVLADVKQGLAFAFLSFFLFLELGVESL